MKIIIVLCIVGFSLLGVNVSANDVLIDENGKLSPAIQMLTMGTWRY